MSAFRAGSAGSRIDELGEERREEAGEGVAQGLAGAIARPQEIQDPILVQAGPRRCPGLLHERGDGRVENDAGRGLPRGLLGRGVAQGTERARLVEQARRADLREVVVVGGHPEDGHDGSPAPSLEGAGGLDRPERLPEHEERPAEEAGLLSGDEGHRLRVGQAGRGLGGPRSLAALLLSRTRASATAARGRS